MGKRHRYTARVTWTGNRGPGTAGYDAYARDYEIACPGRPVIAGSSDPAYLGDASRHNPEDLLVASLSACHMLWYLHLCAVHGVVVSAYEDRAEGMMEVNPDGSGQFARVVLRPRVTIAPGNDAATARRLHGDANAMCFIARSVRFPVEHAAEVHTGSAE